MQEPSGMIIQGIIQFFLFYASINDSYSMYTLENIILYVNFDFLLYTMWYLIILLLSFS